MTLTRRQSEIAEMVAKGLSNKQIAHTLGASVFTVETHIKQAASRLPGCEPQRGKLVLWFFRIDPEELDPTG